MRREPWSTLAAGSAVGAVALGIAAGRGCVPARLRWCHHALFLLAAVTSVAAWVAACAATVTRRRPFDRAFGLLVLAGLPLTRPGSSSHRALGAAAAAASVASWARDRRVRG